MQFGLLATHLAPQDGEEWARLADMSMEQGEMVQAADCLRKAVDADPSVSRYHFTRAELLERMGEKKVLQEVTRGSQHGAVGDVYTSYQGYCFPSLRERMLKKQESILKMHLADMVSVVQVMM